MGLSDGIYSSDYERRAKDGAHRTGNHCLGPIKTDGSGNSGNLYFAVQAAGRVGKSGTPYARNHLEYLQMRLKSKDFVAD